MIFDMGKNLDKYKQYDFSLLSPPVSPPYEWLRLVAFARDKQADERQSIFGDPVNTNHRGQNDNEDCQTNLT